MAKEAPWLLGCGAFFTFRVTRRFFRARLVTCKLHTITMKRSSIIDICRALLFVLMMNTHALTVAGVPKSHWLLADCWLPNGWATVAFVVLSGFGVGYIYAARPSGAARDRAVYRRAVEIILVMFGSNIFFAALRQAAGGETGAIGSAGWWLGFLTLDTPWTISGVLMPTALVLLAFPALFHLIRRSPWAMLAVLVAVRLLAEHLTRGGAEGVADAGWLTRFFLTEGFGGFPVLPFFINGCLGIWLGMLRHHCERHWLHMMGGLILLQLVLYFGKTYYAEALRPGLTLLTPFGALGKFAWMFLIAYVMSFSAPRFLSNMLALIGRHALGSFVMHRIFLQALGIVLASAAFKALPIEMRYSTLWIGTLFLTWGLCVCRSKVGWIDTSLRRVAL